MRLLLIMAFLFISSDTFARTIGVPGDAPSIQAGIDAASLGDTVLVQQGRYLETIDFKGKDIVLGSLFLATGDTSYISKTIIDGNKKGTVVTFKNGETEKAELCGVTVTGGSELIAPPLFIDGGGIYCINTSPYLHHLIVERNFSSVGGGGIFLYKSYSTLESMVIKNNQGTGIGGGIYFKECNNCIIKHSIIFDNGSTFGSGITCGDSNNIQIIHCVLYNENQPIWVSGTKCNIINCTIFGVSKGIYWDIECQFTSSLNIINTIIWTKSQSQIHSYNEANNQPTTFTIAYSDIINNKNGISLSKQDSLYWMEGNISLEPLFNDINKNDFLLQQGSPCIDTGTSFFSINDSVIIDLSKNQYKGSHPDMGAFESDYISTIVNENNTYNMSLSNYPNPFNATTTIHYSLSKPGHVRLAIYTITGQKVIDLLDKYLPIGNYQTQWNGIDTSGKKISSGVYIIRLNTGMQSLSKRVVYMK